MDMGRRFRRARLEAGLSQSQLCENVVSRNMLSQIESGTARPSLATLEILAQRLQKPVGYFFGEDSQVSGERTQAEEAWKAYRQGDSQKAAKILNGQENPDQFQDIPVLRALILLDLTQQALEEKRNRYAGELLRQVLKEVQNMEPLKRKALLLQGRLEGQPADPICRELPSLDQELLLRARAALEQKDGDRACQLLEAAEDRQDPQWAMLRGKACLLQGHFKNAARYFHQAEKAFPEEASPYLEQCYRELEDYKQAYFYACRQK